MKALCITLIACFIFHSAFAQMPAEVTSVAEKRIKENIEKECQALKEKLQKDHTSDVEIDFKLDTFRIERFMEEYMKIDYTTAGMRNATNIGAGAYDSILNKYYKKLSVVLKGEDKKILLKAQRAWLAFRDSEAELIETISKEQYTGGGTLQDLTNTSEYMEMVKTRAISIFDHYIRATQNDQ